MQPFEIHIYAIDSNTSKFKEFTAGTTDLLPSDLIQHIDGVQGMFPVDTYAVYYTEQAYTLTLFSNFSSEGQLSVVVSVDLRRGYELKYPMEILNDLCVEFRKLAGEHRNDLEIAMYNNMPILNELVAKGVVAVPNQPVYNYGTGQCAVVGYNSSEELLSLLKHPSRKEFQNITYLYLLPKHEAARRWNVLSASFKAITNIDFDYNRTYKLRYPDGHQEEISGIDHEVNRDCEKPYCEPIKFHGNLKDHMREWQVALSEDKTTYQIGLQFKPLMETYEIVSKEKGKVLNGVQYSASVGTVEGNMLTLVGEQTAQTPVLALSSGEHFKIEKQDFIPLSKQIIVKLSPLYRYDVSALWNEVKQANGEDEGIVIALIDQEIKRSIHEFSKRDLSSYFDLPYSKAAFVVRETKKYKGCTIFINPDGTIQPGSYHPEQKEQQLEEGRPKNDVDSTNIVPVSINKLKVKWLSRLSNVAIFLIGVVIGLFIYPLINDSKHGEQTEVVDSLSGIIEEQKKTINSFNGKIDQLQDKPARRTAASITKTRDNVDEPEPDTSEVVDDERSLLVEKLRGTAFTMDDIKKLRKMSLTNEEKKLLRSCEACFKLINYDESNKARVVKLIRHGKPTGIDKHDEHFIMSIYYRITIDAHKKAMDKIINDYGKAYVVMNKRNFKTLNEALNVYHSFYGE